MTTERRYVKNCSTDVLDRKRPTSQFLGYRRSNPLPQRVQRTWSGQSPEQYTNLNAPSSKEALHNQDQLQTFNREESAVAKKQRPSKRARERMKKKLERLQLEGRGQQEASLISSESGYETVWDHPTSASMITSVPSPQRPPRDAIADSVTDKDNRQNTSTAVSAMEAYKARVHSRSDSASSANSLITADTSLKKLLKDLHRCAVSINRYQAMLTEHCKKGQQRLVQVFNSLRHDLNTREEDLIQELTNTQQTNGMILQRRKDTASFLRQAAEKANTMEETQVIELKQQIKQFVTDRKVDEEIGTMSRFQADPDDLLPHIMGFGKVLSVRHLYTSWEENPGEQIERSKDTSCFLPISPLLTSHANESASDKSGSQESICNKSDYDSAFVETLDEVQPESCTDCQQSCAVHKEESNSTEESTSIHTIATHTTIEMEGNHVEPTKTPEPITTSDMIHQDNPHTATLPKLPDKIGLAITKLSPLPHNSTPSQRLLRSTREKPHRVHSRFIKHKSAKLSAPSKPEQNPTSLSAHDMTSSKLLTGSPIITTSRSTKWREDKYGSHEKVEELPESEPVSSCQEVTRSPEELVVIQSRVRDSLQQQGVYLYDPFTGARPEHLQELKMSRDTESAEFLPRKKKTPTQLRRERKKRQKERERRQQELERRERDEAEVKETLATPHEGSSNLNAVDMETHTGKSSNDSSSDSFNHPLQTESSATSGEQRKKKKKSKTNLSKGLKDDKMVNENQLTESESFALSSDSENGSESSETQSSPPPELANEDSAVKCAHVKGENGSQNGDQSQTIEENRTTKSPQTTIIHDVDKSESVQQKLVSGTPKDETTKEQREEPDTSLESEEVQAEGYGSPGDCSTEQTAGGRELQQNIAGEASEPTITTNKDSAAELITGGKLNTADQDSMKCSATNEIVVVDQDLPSLAISSCKGSPAEAESAMCIEGSESIQSADLVSETQELRAALDGGNCTEEKNEGSKDNASPCGMQLAVGMEAVENHPSEKDLVTLYSSSQEPETVEEGVTVEVIAEEMESELSSAVKEASSGNDTLTSSSPISHTSTDYEVTHPEIMDSKTDTEEATRPENEDSKTGMNDPKEATLPDNNGSDDHEKNSIRNQDSDVHGKGLEPNSTTQAKSPTTFTEIDRKEPEADTQAKTGGIEPDDIELEPKPGDIELESSDSDQIRSSSVIPETEEQLSTHTDQDKLNSECLQSENVPEPALMAAESKQHEE